MRRLFTFIFVFLVLNGWAFIVPVTGQVIFKVNSPIKRHQNLLPQRMEGNELFEESVAVLDALPADSTQYDSAGTPGIRSVLASESLRIDPRKPSFLVTYMGSPLHRDSSAESKIRFLPYAKNRAVTPVVRPVDNTDSIMIAMLEDSLSRLRKQIEPLRQTNRTSIQSAFDLYRTIPSILPVRLRSLDEFRVSSNYGLRVHPISGRLQNHEGIDLPQPRYTPVYATADGVIDRIVWQPNGMGLAVYIVHPSGYQTGYGHLEDHSVLVGESVRRGQIIGRVGSTGLSTGPHLHYTVLAGVKPVDPASYCFLLLNTLQEQKTRTDRTVGSAVQQRQ